MYTPAALTPVHGDFRLDNMLFHPDPTGARPLIVVDWQTVQLGLGPSDVAYFLGNAFDAEVRRGCEEALVRRYHDALARLRRDGLLRWSSAGTTTGARATPA